MVDLVADLVDLIGEMETAALADPISAILVLIGGILIIVTMVVMGWLTIGGLVSTLRSSLG